VARFAVVQELVRAVRTLRSEFTISMDRPVRASVAAEPGSMALEALRDHRELVALLTNARDLAIGGREIERKGAIPVVGSGFEAFVHLRELIDVAKETARLSKELASIGAQRQRTESKLANDSFVSKAPPEVVAKERQKLEELGRRRSKIEEYLRDLQP
jgi:valyl-tRNA synthetase